MTNKDKWGNFTEGLPAPQNYLDWGWYYLISSCLQRRVWLSASHKPCFPNMYCILVGQPGIGKGITISHVEQCLRFWKKKDVIVQASGVLNKTEMDVAQAVGEADLERARNTEFQGSPTTVHQGDSNLSEPLLFAVAPDATTYEALVLAVAGSVRRINIKVYDEKLQRERNSVYAHASLAFTLQELGSLLRKKTDDTVTYLLGLYDCPEQYEYLTITRQKDIVMRGCLNILAGTTPSFMQKTFDSNLIGEGFTSRVFYIYANKNRGNSFFLPELSQDSRNSLRDILEHIKKLASLYGPVKISDETRQYLESWWHEYEEQKHKSRQNKSEKMIPYYSRKNIHVMKLAMCLHFGETTDMVIPLETFQRAIAVLEKEEKNMHMALVMEDKNPQSKCATKILELLERNEQDTVTILTSCFGIIDKKGIEDALSFLIDTDQINSYEKKDEDTGKNIRYWRLRKL